MLPHYFKRGGLAFVNRSGSQRRKFISPLRLNHALGRWLFTNESGFKFPQKPQPGKVKARPPEISPFWPMKWDANDGRLADDKSLPHYPIDQPDHIEKFHLHRSRIPTSLFKSIVRDMDIVSVQYPFDSCYNTDYNYYTPEAARAECLAPIFNNLLAAFQSVYQASGQAFATGQSGAGKYAYAYQAFFYYPILFEQIQMLAQDPLEMEDDKIDAIAEIVRDCDHLHQRNARSQPDLPVPSIYAILHNGFQDHSKLPTFSFVKFDCTSSTYTIGEDKNSRQREYPLCQALVDPLVFMKNLRDICDLIFDVLILGFIETLKASKGFRPFFSPHDFADEDEERWNVPRRHAETALKRLRSADAQRRSGHTGYCDEMVEEGMQALKMAVESSPECYPEERAMLY